MTDTDFAAAANRIMRARHILADEAVFANLNDFCLDLMGQLLDMGKDA